MKKSQKAMLWLLPTIIIGGLFIPILGYIVLVMMAVLLILSFFRKRYWCWNLCPRGAFLDGVMSKVSPKKPAAKIFKKEWFRWAVFSIFFSVLLYRLSNAGKDIFTVGAVFVSSCLLTTIIAVIMALFAKPRAWCSICPMGTLQDKIAKLR